MFEVYNSTSADYELNSLVEFDGVRYTDCRIRTLNGTTFTFCTPGRYYLHFGAVGSSSVAAGNFAVQLFNNGVAVEGIRSEITSTAAGDPQSLGFSTIVNVLPSNCYIDNTVNLQIRVTSADAGTIDNANLVIFRLK